MPKAKPTAHLSITHLLQNKMILIPAAVLVLFVLLFVVKIPQTTTEFYITQEPYQADETYYEEVEIVDTVCVDTPLKFEERGCDVRGDFTGDLLVYCDIKSLDLNDGEFTYSVNLFEQAEDAEPLTSLGPHKVNITSYDTSKVRVDFSLEELDIPRPYYANATVTPPVSSKCDEELVNKTVERTRSVTQYRDVEGSTTTTRRVNIIRYFFS